MAVEPSFFVRRADPDDIDTLNALYERIYPEEPVTLEALAYFHAVDRSVLKKPDQRTKFLLSLIETSFMAVTVEDEEGHVVGFAVLDDTPLHLSATEDAGTDWETWFQDTFDLPNVDSTNSLWFSTCLIDGDKTIMAEILRTTFSTMVELSNILTFVPATLTEDGAMKILQPFQSHFAQLDMVTEELMAMTHWAAPSVEGHPPIVLSCNRSQVIAPLGIRIARVEDHDNLAAVFDAQSEVVTSVYGDFFIAELIEAQNEENRALVAEVDGRAVGLMCLTSDVDINVLAQCFQVDPYDNLLKGAYMKRVREHSRKLLEGHEASLCAPGDFLQVALGSMDMDLLLESIPKLEDGRINAVQLHGALQMQEFSDEVGEVLQEFEKSIMMLFWQANFLEPMLQENSLLFPSKVSECVQLFMNLDITERKAIAAEVLERWSEVQDILKLTKEAMMPTDAIEGGEEHKEEKDEETLGDLMEADATVDTVVFFKALTQEEQGPFTQDFLAKLLITLHWWGDMDISSPLALLPEDGYREALEKIMESEEGLFVSHPNSPSWLANMPPHSKDVFCVNMFCLDQAFQTQALDFLLPAFSLFPEKDYCIITQPHTAPNTPLLNAFTIVPPQPQNTFGHVLYLIHRASLLGPPKVVYLKPHLLEQVPPLLEVFEEETRKDIVSQSKFFLQERKASELEVFVVDFDSQVVGLIMLQMPSPDVVDRLRCCYHLDDYLLVEHHETGGFGNKGHVRLLHWVLNPLFQKYTRRLLQGALRICGKTAMFLETELTESVSSIYRELLQVAPRRPPQLKKILREPPKVASFCNIEEDLPTEEDLREKERQQLLRESEQTKALSIVAKKLLSETKIPVNARIVVVGASDCGLSFLESLSSIPHLLFNSLTLLAPGGLEYHHAHHLPLVAGTAAYSHQELRRIMLELRVRILDSRMVHIDRQQKCCILHDGSMLPYDYLVVATGLQDDALHALKIQSMGVEHVTDGYRRVNGAMSAADPSIRDLLVEGGTLVKSLIWNPLSYAVVYGRSLNAYCVVQGLLLRKVPPKKIILVLPSRSQEAQGLSVNAFYEGDEVEKKIHHILESMGLKVYEGYRLLGIQQCTRGRLKGLILEDHNGGEVVPLPAEETAEREREKRFPAPEAARAPMGILEEFGASPANLPQKLLACRICITADAVNVDPDIFNSVHGNGLVYDGRLIVNHHFGSTDPAIYGAGSLCEFSRRFQRNNSRYLRHDGFNGREVGAKLAGALLKRLDPVKGDSVAAGGVGMTTQELPGASMLTATEEESSPDLLPEFYMPIAKGGLLPGSLHYYRIHACRRADVQEEPTEIKEEQVIVTDTLDLANGTGHFCRLTLDGFGKVDSITYLGAEALQVESLWSLVGLSETFLNYLYQRWRDNDIPDIVEFLADEWATALFHDRFMDFCHQIKLEMLASEEVKHLINKALEGVDVKEGLSRKLLAEIRQELPSESVKQIQDHLLDYLQENTNHLKTYFLSWQWAEGGRK